MSPLLDRNSKIDYNSNMLGGQKARHQGQNAPKQRRRRKSCLDQTQKGPLIITGKATREG